MPATAKVAAGAGAGADAGDALDDPPPHADKPSAATAATANFKFKARMRAPRSKSLFKLSPWNASRMADEILRRAPRSPGRQMGGFRPYRVTGCRSGSRHRVASRAIRRAPARARWCVPCSGRCARRRTSRAKACAASISARPTPPRRRAPSTTNRSYSTKIARRGDGAPRRVQLAEARQAARHALRRRRTRPIRRALEARLQKGARSAAGRPAARRSGGRRRTSGDERVEVVDAGAADGRFGHGPHRSRRAATGRPAPNCRKSRRNAGLYISTVLHNAAMAAPKTVFTCSACGGIEPQVAGPLPALRGVEHAGGNHRRAHRRRGRQEPLPGA